MNIADVVSALVVAGCSPEQIEKVLAYLEALKPKRPLPHGRRLHSKVWAKIRAQVIARDGCVCRYCGQDAEQIHIDHIHPLSRGGSNELDNLAVSCAPCNIEKSSYTLEELGWA